MKLNKDNSYNGKFAFAFMRSLARVIDQPDAYVELFHKGILVGAIQPQTNDYITRRDVLEKYRSYENYPIGDGDACYKWIGDICICFDEFEEHWI